MSDKIISHVQSDIGRRRDNNEDNFVWLKELWNKPGTTLIGAIDGVGGYEGGEEAAKIAKETIENYLQHLSVSIGGPLHLLKEAIITANNNILKKRVDENLPRMSCVLSVAILDAEKEMLYLGHVGDSRGYIFRNGELVKITKDHSAVGFKEDKGYLTEEEAMHHPLRNEISKMLGEQFIDANDTDAYIDVNEHSFLPGDTVLFCSDGLTDLVNRQQMSDVLSQNIPVEQKVKLLIDKANELGGKDNITVALARYGGKTAPKKKAYKNTIEVPIKADEETTPAIKSKAPRKKKVWWWLLPVLFLAGFLANWAGTKKLFSPGKENRIDTIYIRDPLPLYDTVPLKDTLIQATDTIFNDSARNHHNTTGY